MASGAASGATDIAKGFSQVARQKPVEENSKSSAQYIASGLAKPFAGAAKGTVVIVGFVAGGIVLTTIGGLGGIALNVKEGTEEIAASTKKNNRSNHRNTQNPPAVKREKSSYEYFSILDEDMVMQSSIEQEQV